MNQEKDGAERLRPSFSVSRQGISGPRPSEDFPAGASIGVEPPDSFGEAYGGQVTQRCIIPCVPLSSRSRVEGAGGLAARTLNVGGHHGIPTTRQHRSHRLSNLPRLHELRRSRRDIGGIASALGVGAERGRGAAVLQARLRAWHQLLRHGQRVLLRGKRGDHRPRASRVRPPRRGRHRHEGLGGDAPRSKRRRSLAQGDPPRNRREPEATRDGLRRPLPDSSLGQRDADRRDDGGASRRRPHGQGAVPGRVVHACLAIRQGAARGRETRLDTLRVDAEPLQPPLPRGGA